MTSTAPWRRMILHFSHIGLTDGRTFMIPFGSSNQRSRLWLPHEAAATGRGKRAHTHAQAHRSDTIAEQSPSARRLKTVTSACVLERTNGGGRRR
jgi:hypothetical protein